MSFVPKLNNNEFRPLDSGAVFHTQYNSECQDSSALLSTHSAHSPATMISMKVALVAALVGAASAQCEAESTACASDATCVAVMTTMTTALAAAGDDDAAKPVAVQPCQANTICLAVLTCSAGLSDEPCVAEGSACTFDATCSPLFNALAAAAAAKDDTATAAAVGNCAANTLCNAALQCGVANDLEADDLEPLPDACVMTCTAEPTTCAEFNVMKAAGGCAATCTDAVLAPPRAVNWGPSEYVLYDITWRNISWAAINSLGPLNRERRLSHPTGLRRAARPHRKRPRVPR